MATTIDEKTLAQTRPSDDQATQAYAKPALVRTIVKGVRICNTTGQKATFSIFLDDDGAQYDESTAIAFNAEIKPYGFVDSDTFMAMATTGGTIGVKSSIGGALTFTFWGAEVT